MPSLPAQRFRPHHLFVAAQQHRIQHALQQRVLGLDLPSRRARCRNQFSAAGEVIEIFDDDIGVENDVAIVWDQHRQLLQRRDLRILVVGRARRHGGGDEFDLCRSGRVSIADIRTFLANGEAGEKVSFILISLRNVQPNPGRHCARSEQSTTFFLSEAKTWMLRRIARAMTRFCVRLAKMLRLYAAMISWRCSPRPSMPSVTTSPILRNCGGFMPAPTPGGVPVVMMSPGSSVRKVET